MRMKSSGVVVPTVESAYGSPARAAAAATARSPSVWAIRAKPVGASTTGNDACSPRIVVEGSTRETSRRTLGRNSTRSNASRARAIDSSSPAPPST